MLFQYFYGDSEMNKDLLLDSLFRIILSTVSSGHMKKAALQMNLYLSLRRYYEKNSIEPYYLWEKCLKKIYVEEENEGKNNIFFDEEEWHFSLGRMLKIMSRSMTFNTEQMFLLLKDKKHFSRNFRMLVRKHIKLDSYMQKRLYYMLLDPKQRLDQNLIWIIIAGVLYEK
jgi:hypothetical protein